MCFIYSIKIYGILSSDLLEKKKVNYYTSLLENCDNIWNVLSEVIPTKNSKKEISKQENYFDAEFLLQKL